MERYQGVNPRAQLVVLYNRCEEESTDRDAISSNGIGSVLGQFVGEGQTGFEILPRLGQQLFSRWKDRLTVWVPDLICCYHWPPSQVDRDRDNRSLPLGVIPRPVTHGVSEAK